MRPLTPPPSIPLPHLKQTSTHARTVDIAWSYAPQDEPRFPVLFQVSRAEAGDPTHHVVFEGSGTRCEIGDLKPLTKYIVRLKVRRDDAAKDGEQDAGEGGWSREGVEVEITTADESQANKLTTQLLRAVASNDTATVKFLLQTHGKEISVEARDKYGRTPLMIACQSGPPEIVSALLAAGASLTACTQSGKTGMSLAATFGNIEAANVLLDHDPTCVDTPDQGGSTPLMWAAENASGSRNGPAFVDLLLEKGADVNAEDRKGMTALDRLCSSCGNLKAAQSLLNKGARVILDVSKKHPMTTLMSAALNGHRALCAELMEKWGADPTVETEHGGTARKFALEGGKDAVVEAIDKRMADMGIGSQVGKVVEKE
ncbi:Fibronectin type 3 and ankyrin repeat domains protein 1 [Borealophlyctis nickersoniae]|nr:Fibronectin type 3 and ankyrin repeat domains protein 1 [Borealophlyctis nickersoniae]